ncbi:MAG: MgtC/SapB family protein [Fimbriimonadaceae bacterium]
MTATILLNLSAAFVLGALIGLERQWRKRIVGIRTNALVAVGAAMFVALAAQVENEQSPTRIAAQVVSGIGFLGAGVIIRDGLNVRGVNTAATLWCAAGVGVLAGTGCIAIAATGVALVLAANLGLRSLGWRCERRGLGHLSAPTVFVIRVACREAAERRLRARLLAEASAQRLRLKSLSSEDGDRPNLVQIVAVLLARGSDDDAVERVAGIVGLDDDVLSVRWEAAADLDEDADLDEVSESSARRRL